MSIAITYPQTNTQLTMHVHFSTFVLFIQCGVRTHLHNGICNVSENRCSAFCVEDKTLILRTDRLRSYVNVCAPVTYTYMCR